LLQVVQVYGCVGVKAGQTFCP